jgi:hypothetical protein
MLQETNEYCFQMIRLGEPERIRLIRECQRFHDPQSVEMHVLNCAQAIVEGFRLDPQGFFLVPASSREKREFEFIVRIDRNVGLDEKLNLPPDTADMFWQRIANFWMEIYTNCKSPENVNDVDLRLDWHLKAVS